LVLIKRRNISKATVITPRRKKAVVSLTTGCYRSAATNIVAFSKTHNYVLSALAKQMRTEMKTICSLSHNSILRSNHEAVKHFSWEIIWKELVQQVPTLVSFLEKLLPKSEYKFFAYLISVILKHRCKHMSLFQRVMSVLLYANGTSKQVSKSLNRLSRYLSFVAYRCTIIYIHLRCVCHQLLL